MAEAQGVVTQVLGNVVDVEFPAGELPDIFDAIGIEKAAIGSLGLWPGHLGGFVGKWLWFQLQYAVAIFSSAGHGGPCSNQSQVLGSRLVTSRYSWKFADLSLT